MTPFNAPNPYGSYFNFGGVGDPRDIGRQVFVPGMTSGLSSGVTTMMGSPAGGFNPTASETLDIQMRNYLYQRFMSDQMRRDPRTGAVSSLVLQAMAGNDQKRREAILSTMGGAGNFNDMMGFMLNLPGVSGFMGGSVRSLGIGALAIGASGGMTLNGVGAYGDSYAQLAAARAVMSTVQSRFYTGSGSANLAMTGGLNRDQIGGIMASSAAQGAFGGLNLGTIDRQQGFRVDQSSLDRIAKFTSQAAKALATIIDTYGDASVGELMQKAHQITGLDFSRIGNADLMRTKLGNLRQAAQINGINERDAYDLSAAGIRMGQAFGLSPGVSGALFNGVPERAMFLSRQFQSGTGSFASDTYTAHDIAARMNADRFGMMRDPLGARRAAVEMMIQNKTISGAEAEAARKMVEGTKPDQVNVLDASMRTKFGVHMPEYIRMMGGAESVFASLSQENRDAVGASYERMMNPRREFQIGRMAARRLNQIPGVTGGAEDLSFLIRNLSSTNTIALLEAADRGGDLHGILSHDLQGARNPQQYVDAVSRLTAAVGAGNLAGAGRDVYSAMRSNPFTMGFTSEADRRMEVAKQMRRPVSPDDIRQIRSGSFAQGLLDRLDGRDMNSALVLLASMERRDSAKGINDQFIFGKQGEIMLDQSRFLRSDGTLDYERFRASMIRTRNEMLNMPDKAGTSIVAALGIGGDRLERMSREGLEEVYQRLDPLNVNDLLKEFQVFQVSDGSSMLAMRSKLQEVIANKPAVATLKTLRDLKTAGKTGSAWNSVMSMAASIVEGRTIGFFDPDDASKYYQGKTLSEAKRDKLRQELGPLIGREAFHMGMTADQLVGLAKTDRVLGASISKELGMKLEGLKEDDDSDGVKEMRAWLKTVKDRFDKEGFDTTGGSEKAVQKIIGTLNIQNGKGELTATMSPSVK